MGSETYDRFIATQITRGQFMRGIGAAGAALVMPSLFAACGDSQGSASGSLQWALSEPVAKLNPYDTTPQVQAALQLVLDSVYTVDRDLKLQPKLATEVVEPRGRDYVLPIRTDVMFSDGTRLTAEDVAYSLRQHIDPKTASAFAYFLAVMEDVEARGPDKVAIKLSEPSKLFPFALCCAGRVLSKAHAEQQGKELGTPTGLILGSGPYVVDSFVPDERVTFTRNAKYWGTNPDADQIVLRPIVDQSSRLLAMRSGEIDGTFELPLDQLDEWERIPDATTTTSPGFDVYMLIPNNRKPPWNDAAVRRALAHCVDRAGLVTAVLGGNGTPAASLTPTELYDGVLSESESVAGIREYDLDVDSARRELAASAHPDGFRDTLEVPEARKPLQLAAQSVSRKLGEIGIDLEVKVVPFAKWVESLLGGKGGLQIVNLSYVFPDAAELPNRLLGGGLENPWNLAGYENDAVDALLEKGRLEADPKARAAAIVAAQARASEEMPYVWMLWAEYAAATNNAFRYDGVSPYYFVQNWAELISPA